VGRHFARELYVPLNDRVPEAEDEPEGIGMRLLVLEMTIAAVAARLPQADFEEVISMLVFVANSSQAARDLEGLDMDAPRLADAGRYATDMLERIAQSRRSERSPGQH
jgi:hypothetical protein